jgi:alpha-tubulin suppressor-like RCC1 family protein
MKSRKHHVKPKIIHLGGLLLLGGHLAGCGSSLTPAVIDIIPADPYHYNELEVVVLSEALTSKGVEINGAGGSYEYRWLVDGIPQTSLTDKIVPSLDTSGDAILEDGQLWTVEVTPTVDGVKGPVSTAEVAINNRPTTSFVLENDGNPHEDLVANVETPEDKDPLDADKSGVRIEWTWSDTVGNSGSWTAPGTDDPFNVPNSQLDIGETWTATVTPFTILGDGYDREFADGDSLTAFITFEALGATISGTPKVMADEDGDGSGDRDTIYAGDTLVCADYTVVDPEDPTNTNLAAEVSWYRNGSFETKAESYAGNFVKTDAIYCSATPYDEDTPTDLGDAVDSPENIVANALPVIDSVEVSPSDPISSDDLICNYTTSDADIADTSITVSVVWSDGTLGDTLAFGDTLTGTTYYCEATPNDGTEFGLMVASESVTVANAAPTLVDLRVRAFTDMDKDGNDATAIVGDTLECAYTWDDADGDPDNSTLSWAIDGIDAGESTNKLTDGFVGEQTVSCTVTPDDGYGAGTPETVDIVIINSKPIVTDASIEPAEPGTEDVLSVVAQIYDADNHPTAFSVSWYVNNLLVISEDTLDGATYFEKGDAVYAKVKGDDGFDTGSNFTTDTITIGNTAPSITSVSISPDPATVTHSLDCSYSGFNDPDGDSDASTFEWLINGTSAGSTSSLTDGFVKGDSVKCKVTPSDGSDTGTKSSATITVSNSAPSITGATISPASPSPGETLTCSSEGYDDDDGDPEASTVSWSINNTWAADGDTLNGGFDTGDEVKCSVTSNDGIEDGNTKNTTITVSNTLPTVDSIVFSPDPLYTDDDLLATVSSSDADGDPVSTSFAWYVDGAKVAETSDTLSGADFAKGQAVHVVVTPNDTKVDGDPVTSGTLTVSNSAPVLSSVTVDPDPGTSADSFSCAYTTTDADGDIVNVGGFSWTINGVDAFSNSQTLQVAVVEGNVITCTVHDPTDGEDTGSTLPSGGVTVGNGAPYASGAILSPDPPTVSDDVICDPIGPIDTDGHVISNTCAWSFNGVADTSTTDCTLTAGSGLFARGDTIDCDVSLSDGTDQSSPYSANQLTVANALPEASGVTISPAVPGAGDMLSCSYVFTDADGDGDSSTVRWEINGSPYSGGDGNLDIEPPTAELDAVTCIILPNDGLDDGMEASGQVVIGNSPPTTYNVAISPDPGTVKDSFSCGYDYYDTDGDPDQSTLEWFINGTSAGASTSLTSGYVKGDLLECTVTPNDGVQNGTPETDSLTVSNALPTLTSATISPDPAYTDSTLECTSQGYLDSDGDPEQITFEWFNTGASVGTGSTYDWTLQIGDTVVCVATPNDGIEDGTPVNASVVIANRPPSIDAIAITPNPPQTGDILSCAANTSDLEGEIITTQYDWTVNGVQAEGWADLAVSASTSCALDHSGQLHCWGTEATNYTVLADRPAGAFSELDVHYTLGCAIDGNGDLECWGDSGQPTVDNSSSPFHDINVGWKHYCALKDNGAMFCGGDATGFYPTPCTDCGQQVGSWKDIDVDDNVNWCGVRSNGAIDCWGNFTYAPPIGNDFTKVTVGSLFGCGLRTDGSIECFGIQNGNSSTDFDQVTDAPIGTGFVDVEAGRESACALDAAGNATCWGRGLHNSFDIANHALQTLKVGWTHACGIDLDGALHCAGLDTPNQYNEGQVSDAPIGVIDGVSAGANATCGLVAGELDCWGINDHSTWDYGLVVNAPIGRRFRQVSMGFNAACGIDSTDDTLSCWGDDTYDQLTDAPTDAIRQVSMAGPGYTAGGHGCAILDDCGYAMDCGVGCWGNDDYSQVTDTPGSSFMEVQAGPDHNCAIDSAGDVECWGDNAYGQAIDPVNKFDQISVGRFHSCGLLDDSSIYCFGDTTGGAYDQGQVSNAPTDTGYMQITSGNQFSCAIHGTLNDIVCWGDDDYGQVSDVPAGEFRQVTAGQYHACATTLSDELVCWGLNIYGQAVNPDIYGDTFIGPFERDDNIECVVSASDSTGTTVDTEPTTVVNTPPVIGPVSLDPDPLYVDSDPTCTASFVDADGDGDQSMVTWEVSGVEVERYTKVASGSLHACGLTSIGAITCWGTSSGNSADPDYDVGQVTGAPNGAGYIELTSGAYHSCALNASGDIECWGADSGSSLNYGQVNAAPQGSGYTALYSGYYHSCALDSADTLSCWGRNDTGQVTSAPTTTPGYSSTSLGLYHGCALNPGGSVDCWGSPGASIDYAQVSDAPTGSDFVQVVSGLFHSCALTSGGAITCWGPDETSSSYDFGQVTDTPTDSAYVALWGGGYHNCAAKADGLLNCWGLDVYNQVTNTPTGADYTGLSIARHHTCAVTPTGGLTCWGIDDGSADDYGQVTNTPEGFSFTAGDTIQCFIEAYDGIDVGNTGASTLLAVDNSDPVVTNLSISPSPATKADTLTCSYDFFDADGDSDASDVYWFVDGVTVDPASTTLDPSNFSRGDMVTCFFIPTDSAGMAAAQVGHSVTIENAAPSATISLTPSAPEVGDTLTCDYTALDADGDSFSESYTWLINGEAPKPVVAIDASYRSAGLIDATGTPHLWGKSAGLSFAPTLPLVSLEITVGNNEYGSETVCGIDIDKEIQCSSGSPPAGTYTQLDGGKHYFWTLNTDGSIQFFTQAGYMNITPPDDGPFIDIAAGHLYACAIRDTGEVVCIGNDDSGDTWEIGAGSNIDYGQLSAAPTTGSFTAIDATRNGACAIQAAGGILCWGDDSTNIVSNAPVSGNYVAIGVGLSAACAVDDSGALSCWGDPTHSVYLNAPAGTFIELEVAHYTNATGGDKTHACALTDEGAVICWGDDTNGQVADAPQIYSVVTAGMRHTCALTTAGGIECWGVTTGNTSDPDNDHGQVSDAPTGSDYIELDSGGFHSCALTAAGLIECWGANGNDNASASYWQVADAPTGSGYTAVYAWGYSSCAIDDSENLTCWGRDDFNEVTDAPTTISTGTTLAFGFSHGCTLDDSGAVDCWGHDASNQVTNAPTDSGYTALTSGRYHSCVLNAAGEITCWGYDSEGQVSTTPTDSGYLSLSSHGHNNCAAKSDGLLTCWGDDSYGAVTDAPTESGYTGLSGHWFHTCALTAANEVECWGIDDTSTNDFGQVTNTPDPLPTLGNTLSVGFDVGDTISCEIALDDGYGGAVVQTESTDILNSLPTVANATVSPDPAYADSILDCDYDYDDANGDLDQSTVSWEVNGVPEQLAPYTKVTSGSYHNCALTSTGRIDCWGTDSGNPGFAAYDHSQVTDAPTGSGYIDLDSGGYHSCALSAAGAIECWGADGDYDGSPAFFGQVTNAPIGSGYTAIYAGGYTSCAVDASQYLTCWGRDDYNQVTDAPSTLPTGYTLASGGKHACALDAAGLIDCWGRDDYNQVTNTPTDGGYTALDSGSSHSCALNALGEITCWGRDDQNQVTDTPTDSGYVSLWAYGSNACAAKIDNLLTCWGDDFYNQVTNAPSGTGYTGLDGGTHHACALTANSEITCWGNDGQSAYNHGQVTDTPSHNPIYGDTVQCTVEANDGTDIGTSATSSTITISNTPPVVSNVTISPNPATTADTLTCPYSYSDIDGQGDQSMVDWQINSVVAGSGTSLSSGYANGDVVSCGVTPYDGVDSGASDSATITITNSPPTVTSVSITPDPPTTTDTLTCDYTLDDADGDPTSADVQWIVNGVDVSGFVKVRTHLWVSCALDLSGEITCWGDTGSSAIENTPAGSFRDFSIGDRANDPFICALPTATDSGAVCWGNDDEDQVSNAPITGDYVQIDAGYGVACGRRGDGSVTCWGYNPGNETYPRVGPYIDVSAGNYQNCGILANGTLECWGNETYGIIANTPTAGPYVDVNLYEFSPCVLDAMGEITCWGSWGSSLANSGEDPPTGPFEGFHHGYSNGCAWDSSGALTCWGVTSSGVKTTPSVDLHSVNLGWAHACGLDDAGMPVCWGSNSPAVTAAPASLETISADNRTTCAVNDQSRLKCWGWEDAYNLLTDAPSGEGWVNTSMGRDNACAIDDQGQITCWGRSDMNTGVPTGSGFFSLSVGGYSSCALDASGAPYCWGSDTLNQVSHAPTAGGFQAVAAGNKFMCAIDAVGALTCWGEDNYGQATPPTGTYTQVAGGNRHGCALDTGGYITCWGVTSGQTFQSDYGQVTDAPTDGGYVHIAGNQYTSCAIDGNEAVSCWGEWATEYEAAFVPGVAYVELALGISHICGLDDQGSVTCWEATNEADGEPVPMPIGGDSLVGGYSPGDIVECAVSPTDGSNIGTTSTASSTVNSPPTATNVDIGALYVSTTSITCTYDYADMDGDTESSTTFIWMENSVLAGITGPTWNGSLSMGETLSCTVTPHDGLEAGAPVTVSATVVNEPPTVSVSVIPNPPATDDALTCDITISDNDGDLIDTSYEWLVEGASIGGLYAVSIGEQHSCALTASGVVLCWGLDDAGQVNDRPTGDGYSQVLAVGSLSCALHTSGTITCWGDDSGGQLTDAPVAANFESLHSNDGSTLCGLKTTGRLVCWGEDEENVVTEAPSGTGYTAVAVQASAACAINAVGMLGCWGDNADNWMDQPPPASGFLQVDMASNGDYGCAIKADNAIACFGFENSEGAIFNQPMGSYTAVHVFDHDGACALSVDGQLDCWGTDTNNRVLQAPSDSDFTSFGLGKRHGCALDAGGEITCWGIDTPVALNAGQVDNAPAGSGFSSLVTGAYTNCATEPMGETSCWGRVSSAPMSRVWVDVDTASNHTCAISDLGDVQCWGWDYYGAVTGAPTGTGFIQVANGENHSCAIDLLGMITCWGDNNYNQVVNTPTNAGFTQVAAGLVVNCALDGAGVVSCWGTNTGYGVLSETPTGSGYTAVAAGEYTACALTASGQVECWGSNNYSIKSAAPTGSGYTHLALGQMDACVLDAAGQITCWGDTDTVTNDAPTGSGYIDVDTYTYHACALDAAGEITCWGVCDSGECDEPTELGFLALGVGMYYSCAVDSYGEVQCWGIEAYGEISDSPPVLPGLTDTLLFGFDAGESVECSVYATDGINEVYVGDTVIVNTPPSVTNVSIDYTGSLTVNDTPSCSYSFVDADFDPDNSTVQWLINGSTANTGTTLTDLFVRGDVVACMVTPNDGYEDGQPVQVSETVGNAKARASNLAISPASPTPGDTPTCDWTYSDSDGDPEQGTTVEWLVNGVLLQTSSVNQGPVTGILVTFQTGDQITCTVTPNDGINAGYSVSLHVGTCGGNCDPVVTNVSISPDPVTTAVTTVDCDYDYFDADNDADASSIYWYVNGSPAAVGVSYSGVWNIGDELKCQVLPSDGGTPGTPLEASTTVLNAPPELSNFSITPTTPTAADYLMASGTTYDADGDTVSVIYEWYVDGVLNLETDDTLAPTEFTKGQSIYVVGIPDDGSQSGIPITSTAVTIENSQPIISGPTLRMEGDTYVCDYGFDDADGDQDQTTISWLVNGYPVWGDSYSAVALGSDFTCGLDSTSGAIRCFGDDSLGQLTPPQTTAMTISASSGSACALDGSGVPFCWGDDSDGLVSQAPTSTVDELALGGSHGCSRSGIAVSCWGDDNYNQITDTPGGFFSQVYSGANYSCAMDSFGNLSCWGLDTAGETSPPASTYAELSLAGDFGCGIDGTGGIFCWGNNANWGLDAPSGVFSGLATGAKHACALDPSGNISCWGDNGDGQTQAPAGSFSILASGSTADHSCGIDGSGELRCWGDNESGQAPRGGTLSTGFLQGDTVSCSIIPTDGEWSGTELSATDIFDEDNDGYTHDCDDTDPAINPGGTEICDGKDNDCDGDYDEGAVCPCTVDTYGSSVYQICDADPLDWWDAGLACAADGYHLATVDDTAESDWILALNDSLWLGLNDIATDGVWLWEDDSPLAAELEPPGGPWTAGEPNNALPLEYCVHTSPFGWNDNQCVMTSGYICEAETNTVFSQ